jgi:hypothetical protein
MLTPSNHLSLQEAVPKGLWSATVVLCSLLAVGLAAQGQSAPAMSNETFITGISWDRSPHYYEYWIDFDRLPGKVSWNQGKEPFPLSLDAEVRRASGWLVQQKQLTNELELQAVQILRSFCRRPAEPGTSQEARASTNAWVVTLKFTEVLHAPILSDLHCVTMLLDGTYATERIRKKTPPERDMTAPRASPSASLPAPRDDSGSTHSVRKPPQKENPYELVRRADFQVPAVQWNPETPFPLDLDELVSRTHSSMVETNGMPEAFALQALSIDRYFPDGAVPDVATRLLNHRWHWLLRCSYAEKPGHWREYCAYILLDGRTLSVSRPEEAPSRASQGAINEQ